MLCLFNSPKFIGESYHVHEDGSVSWYKNGVLQPGEPAHIAGHDLAELRADIRDNKPFDELSAQIVAEMLAACKFSIAAYVGTPKSEENSFEKFWNESLGVKHEEDLPEPDVRVTVPKAL